MLPSSSNYCEIKQYTILPPFASGKVYRVELDAKRQEILIRFFGICADGNNQYTCITNSYSHYQSAFALDSTGNSNVEKYLLFRVFKNSAATVKNIKFYKLSVATDKIYIDWENVNLTISGNVDLYAIWTAN